MPNQIFILSVWVSLLSVGIIGCTQQQPMKAPSTASTPLPIGLENQYSEPYDLQVVREMNDGELFSVVLKLVASKQILSMREGDELSVELALFTDGLQIWKRGQTIRELVLLENYEPIGLVPMSEVVGKELLLQVPLPAQKVTDYQLTLVWGADMQRGKGYILRATAVKRGVERCEEFVDEDTACAVEYQAELELVNPYAQPLHGIEIDTWYAKGSDTENVDSTSKRATVALDGVTLQPQERVSIELYLSEPLPVELEQEGYTPRFAVNDFMLGY